ncbi:MAG: transglycosylase domain-containing protein, partial [Deltaproteobacteria bacterium]|nr:transglycosylase domain-containing protein [Deltaproteobacteria bacterium]
MKRLKKIFFLSLSLSLLGLGLLAFISFLSLKALPDSLSQLLDQGDRIQILDRLGEPLSQTYQNPWNNHDLVKLHQVPSFLKSAFILSEDKRFYEHQGIDWQARLAALWVNIRHLSALRGASTISEQVVRLIHPRPRTLWSRWLEGFEA